MHTHLLKQKIVCIYVYITEHNVNLKQCNIRLYDALFQGQNHVLIFLHQIAEATAICSILKMYICMFYQMNYLD